MKIGTVIWLVVLPVCLEAQVPETRWRPIPAAAFSVYDSYPPGIAPPAPAEGFLWTLPRMNGSPGRWPDGTGCRYEDPYVNGLEGSQGQAPMRVYDPQGKQLAGPIIRGNPAYINRRTSLLKNMKGLGLTVRFTGTAKGGYSSPFLQQAAFYHSQRCYTAATEFGFRRFVTPAGGYVQFYYGINVNCDFPGKCRRQTAAGTWQNLEQQGGHLDLNAAVGCPVPSGTYGYEAWLSADGATWRVVVRDTGKTEAKTEPKTGATTGAVRCSAALPVQPWFRAPLDYAGAMRQNGLAGYITLTSQHDGVSSTTSTMDVQQLFVPQ